MKVTTLAQGTGVPAQSDSSLGRTADSNKLARAKAIASGQTFEEPPKSSGDAQVDKINTKRIKMRTQVSTNRHDSQPEPVAETPQSSEMDTQDTNEPVNGTEETKPIDPQVAAFIKAKRALQVKEREIEQREKALADKSPVNMDDYIAKADLVANPLKVFDAGVTYDSMTEAVANSSVNPEIQTLKAELKALKEEFTGQFSTRDQQAEEQVLNQIEREALDLTSQGDEYEAIRTAKAHKKVKELIHRTWKATGEIMDVTQAAELVENQLIEDALPFAKIKRFQSKLTPAQEVQAAQIPAPHNPNVKVMRTLTNRDSASPVMDRRARAIAAMNGTLKKG